MAQIPYPSVTKPKPLGNPADKNYFSGSAIPVAPKTPAVSYVRPTGPAPAPAPVAAPSMGRAMTVASPAAITLAKNLSVNSKNPTAASSVPYVEPEVKKPTWGDNLVTGGLRYLMDPAIDFTAGMFPLTAPLAIPASAAAAGAGENWAQQYEMGRGLRTEKNPGEVALASGMGMLPLAAGTIGKLLKNASPEVIARIGKLMKQGGTAGEFASHTPSRIPYGQTTEAITNLSNRGGWYDEKGLYNLPYVNSDTVKFMGTHEGRPTYQVLMDGIKGKFAEWYYKSTGRGKKGVDGLYQVFSDITDHPELNPYWVMKDQLGIYNPNTFINDSGNAAFRDFRNYYGSRSFGNVAQGLPRAILENMNKEFPRKGGWTKEMLDSVTGFNNLKVNTMDIIDRPYDPRVFRP